MRIGVDAACWSNPRGYGRFTRDLLSAVLCMDHDNEYVFFLDPQTNKEMDIPYNAKRVLLNISESPSEAASATGRRSIPDMLKAAIAVSREKLDIFLYPSVYTYFPVLTKAKKVVIIHDVIAEKYPELVFDKKKHRMFWNLKVWLANKQADMIVTVSDFARNGIADHFGLPVESIKVVSEAADDIFSQIAKTEMFYDTLSRFNIKSDTKYILYVGGIAPHKNLSTLVLAYSKLLENPGYKDVKLVLVGDYEKDVFLIDYKLKELLNRIRLTDKVIFTGYIDDNDLVCLYNAAYVFVLPSFCEGFGLPAVEAMACGTPVIGSKTTSVPEVVGDAGLFFDPESPDELLDKLLRIFNDSEYRTVLEQRSIQRASEFSWDKSASSLLNIFNDIGAYAVKP